MAESKFEILNYQVTTTIKPDFVASRHIAVWTSISVRPIADHPPWNVGVSGDLYFFKDRPNDLTPGTVGVLSRGELAAGVHSFVLSLNESLFDGIYAVLSTDSPVFLTMTSEMGFEAVSEGTKIPIKLARLQTEKMGGPAGERVGGSVDAGTGK